MAVQSRSAIRSAHPARGSPTPQCTPCGRMAAVTPSLPRASAAAKVSRPCSRPSEMMRFVRAGRILDALAVLVVLFVAYKLLVAPRFLSPATAYPAPRVAFATLSGKPFVLREHRGRVVFLDFWASWCEPCKISLPMVERFARAHPEVDVVPIDVGEPRALAQAFARSHGLTNVALDPKALSRG